MKGVDCVTDAVGYQARDDQGCHSGPRRARSWKRRIEPRKAYGPPAFLIYSERTRREKTLSGADARCLNHA
jgi:hypothetical protein